MLDELVKAFGRLGEDEPSSEVPPGILRPQELPSNLTIHNVATEVVKNVSSDDVGSLRALQACLESENLTSGGKEDDEDFASIAEYVARSILAVVKDPSDEAQATKWRKFTIKGGVGLRILCLLSEKWTVKLSSQVLLSIAAFVNANDPWATKETSATAQALLKTHLNTPEAHTKFIVDTILTGFLRPLFSKSRPATVTASGRKAEFVEKSRYDGGSNLYSDETKPWKREHGYSITVFEWAVTQADEELLNKHWHMFTPVLLTLLDEPQVDIKIRALSIFSAFWARCSANLMQKVGLADVFEQAIFPAVLYLPTLTPEDESISILNAAYPSLFQIAGLPYPEENIGDPSKYPEFSDFQKKLFDKIIREGIVTGYQHAGEHIRLTKLFLGKLQSIVNGMGILAVKHLKDIIPMISDVMTDPFAINYPPALLAAAKLLQSTMRCCWPRVSVYCNDIVKTLTICWLNVEEEDFPTESITKEDLETNLVQAAKILSAIMKADEVDLLDRVSPLIKKKPLLGSLFRDGVFP